MKDSQTLPAIPTPQSLDDDLKRLCKLHGKQVVRDAALRLTALPRGRHAEKDGAIIGPLLRDQARHWLEGREQRSNYSIAQEIAKMNPGQSEISTIRRVQRKLSAKRDIFVRIFAFEVSQSEFPYTENLRALDELVKYEGANAIWSFRRSFLQNDLALYLARFGEIPATMSATEIKQALQTPEERGLLYLKGLGNNAKP